MNLRIFSPLVLALPLVATPIYTNTSDVSLTCRWNRQSLQDTTPNLLMTSTDPAANLICPAGYIGASISGYADGLSVAAGGGGLPGDSSYSFTSQFQDTITETDGSGQGIERFSIVINWRALQDTGPARIDASLSLDGVTIWQETDIGHGHNFVWPQTSTATIFAPFVFGQPFTIVESITASGSCSLGSFCSSNASGQLAIEALAIPEPRLGWLAGVFGCLVCLRKLRR